MCPNSNSYINRFNSLLKPANVLKALKKNAGTTSPISKTVNDLTLMYYMPILAAAGATVALNLKTREVNNDEEDLRKIYEIDKESFEQIDSYESYEEFKSLLKENKLSSYLIADENNNMLGYYQLEPVVDNNLYIDSMGLKSEFRKTKKGYQAIKYAWAEILQYATENDVKVLSLHVADKDKSLLNMYTKMGFVVKQTLPNYYEDGSTALYMELEIPEEVDEISEAEQVVATLSPKEKAEKDYIEAYQKAQAELVGKGFNNGIIESVLEKSSYFDKNGYPIFSSRLMDAYINLIDAKIEGDMNEYSKIFEKLTYKDSNGDLFVDLEALEETKKLLEITQSSYTVQNYLRHADSKEGLSLDCLKFIRYLHSKIKDYYIYDFIQECQNEDKTFNNEVAAFCRYCIAKNISPLDIQVIQQVMIKQENGVKEVRDYSIFNKIKNEVESPHSSLRLFTYYSLKDIIASDCDIEDYLKYVNTVKQYVQAKNIDTEILASMVKACVCQKRNNFNSYQAAERRLDFRLLDVYKKYEKLLIPEDCSYQDKDKYYMALGRLIDACKIKDKYQGEVFDEEIMQKALKLIEKGMPLIDIEGETVNYPVSDIINACKKEKTNVISGIKMTELDDAIYEKVLSKLESGQEHYSKLIPALKFVKEYNPYEKAEVFNLEAFDYFYNIYKTQTSTLSWHNYHDGIFKDESVYPSIKMDVLKTVAERVNNLSLDIFVEKYCDKSSGKFKYVFNRSILEAFEKISNIDYVLDDASYKNDKFNMDIRVLKCSKESQGDNEYFVKEKFEKICEYLQSGYTAKDLYVFQYKSYAQVLVMDKLVKDGIDLYTSGIIVENCCDKNGSIDQAKLQMCLEFYEKGLSKYEVVSWGKCNDTIAPAIGLLEKKTEINKVAYERLKDLIEREMPIDLIDVCKDNGIFKDRIYKLLINLKERNYPNDTLNKLMRVCFSSQQVPQTKGFCNDIYNKIFELERIGIDKANIASILASCEIHNKFIEDAYKKVPELYYKGYDDKGIAKILTNSIDSKTEKFSQDRFDMILKLTAPHNRLKDAINNNDEKVISKLLEVASAIRLTEDNFGEDVLNYAVSLRIGGYSMLARNCEALLNKLSIDFIDELKSRLAKLPSPELKVKKLQILGALVDKVSESNLYHLLKMIESPVMTEAQVEIVNSIFSDETLSYDEKIEKFVKELDVPNKNKDYIVNYLKQTRYDKQINRPLSAEEQSKQMDEYAQKMLTNPLIPLDKKIKYVEEYKIKKADLLSNPEKYVSPRLFPKAMRELQAVVQAYINIPNSDIRFNNAIYQTTYSYLGIETTSALLENLKYDSKYFDRLYSTDSKFRANFKKLIELVKLNEGKTLAEARLTLPEENSLEYEKYQSMGLIEQIKANLDTKRQFEEANLNFDRWNAYDEDLRSENFNVSIDTDEEYSNLKFAIINELQGELISKINSKEVENMFKHISDKGFVLLNNEIFYLGTRLSNNSIERFLNLIIKYAEQNDYWQKAYKDETTDMSDTEKESIRGFIDHVKGFKKKYEDIQAGKDVSNIYVRLSDINDIGRNIFFGNHVSCCNKVESSYAGYSAPQHLLNAYTRGIEIVDEYGISYGNSLCYFANIDGKITFVIDSFEANGKLASNPIVTEKIVEFAKQVCKTMGCEDAPVVFGPRYNHLSLDDYESTTVNNFKVVGTVSAPTYCDTLGGLFIQDQINFPQNNIAIHTYKAS